MNKSWKNELVTSAIQAENYLIKVVENMNLPNTKIESNSNCGLLFEAYYEKKGTRNGIINLVVNSNSSLSRSYTGLHNISVGKDFQGKKLGSLLVKCILAVGYEYNASFISLSSASKDGAIFWPRMGNSPHIHARSIVQKEVLELLNKNKNQVTGNGQKTIQNIVDLSKRHPIHAWHMFAQSNIIKTDESNLTKDILSSVIKNTTTAINLHSQTTLSVLQKRLGRLPPFQPKKASPYKRVRSRTVQPR